MKLSNSVFRKFWQITLSLVLFAGLYSCGTYQSAYNYEDDGIYASSKKISDDIVIVDKSVFDKTYFSKQLEQFQDINDEDIITDLDEYYYDDSNYNDSLNINYNQPWDYAQDVTINIDSGYGYGGYGYEYMNPYYSNYSHYGYYSYYNNYYSPWRSRHYSPFYYGYNNPYNYGYYMNPYYGYGDYYSYGNYYSPYYYGYNGYRNNRYYASNNNRRYDNYGKRITLLLVEEAPLITQVQQEEALPLQIIH